MHTSERQTTHTDIVPTYAHRPRSDSHHRHHDREAPETRPEEIPVTTSPKIAVTTADAPAPAPVFSQGVRRGPFLQVSGQGPADPATGAYVHLGDVAAQTTRTLTNVEAVLAAGGASFDDVIMLRVYLTTRDHFAAMNAAYGEFLADRCQVLPSRTTVFVGLPEEDMLVEIDALAVLGE
jgi:reactive intermediate/imine deaminase